MKKVILLLVTFNLCTAIYAKTFDDWSNEDLCRWLDAMQVPDPILIEIEIRNLICQASPEITETSSQEPVTSEYGTVFPSPVPQEQSDKKLKSGMRVIFNYKITL
jgi:hypothetical protein